MKDGAKSPIKEAKALLEKYKISSFPVNIEEICKSEGVQVHYVDFTDIQQKIQETILGAIQKQSDGKYAVLVNEDDSEARARFTIAHELGHYLMYTKESDSKIITNLLIDGSYQETAANKFAAELLMPKDLVLKEYKKMVIPVSDSLAKKFNVSKQAMRIRLDGLELMYV